MKHRNAGSLLFLALLLSSACATTSPPRIPVFIHDGLGGADGRDVNGSVHYKAPSELKNWWMTDQTSMARFTAWCYRVDVTEVENIMSDMRANPPVSTEEKPE